MSRLSDAQQQALNDFGCIADVYDELVSWAPYEHWVKKLEPRLRRHGLPGGALILDAACGTGLSMMPWLRRGYRLVGADASPAMLAGCRQKLDEAGYEAETVEQDLLDLHLPRRFDLALCTHSGLDYILDDADLERAFRSIRRCLKAGGLFAFDKCLDEPAFYKDDYSDSRELAAGTVQFHYRWDRSRHILEQRCTVFRTNGSPRRTDVVYHLKAVAPKELAAMLTRAGFEVVERPRQFKISNPGTAICRAV